MSHVGSIFCHIEAVVRAGAHLCAILSPVYEGVASVGSSRQRAVGAVVIGAATRHGATCAWIGIDRDGVAVDLEVGHIGGAFGYGDVVVGRGSDYCAVFSPVHEGIACRGSSRQTADVAVVIHASARDRTAFRWVGCGRNLIAVDIEMCHIRGVFVYGNVVIGRGGDYCAILGPVYEGVTRVGCHRQGADITVVISSSTAYGTTTGRVSSSRDGVAVDLEVGHIGGISSHGEAVGRIGTDHGSFIGPVHERVACCSGGRQSACATIVISTCTGNCTARGRVGISRDGVAVGLEVGHIGGIFRHGEEV